MRLSHKQTIELPLKLHLLRTGRGDTMEVVELSRGEIPH